MTYSAHDMAQASADGFRAGVASVTVAADPAGLLPCPFCLCPEVSATSNGHANHYVECDGCGASGPAIDTEPQAITAWNTRAAALPQGVWLPIESAPRDGTYVLGWRAAPSWPHGIQIVAAFDGVEDCWTDGCFVCTTPTHWQPLPTPPPAELGKG